MSEARKTVVADAHWIEPYPDRVADLPSGRYEARLWSYTDGSRALEISPLPENVGKHGVWSGRSLHFTKPADPLTIPTPVAGATGNDEARCVACGGIVSTDRNLGT